MKYYQANIPLPDEYKDSIMEAISYGVKDDIIQFKKDTNLVTENGLKFLKWDFINTNIARAVSCDRLEWTIIKRGGWKLVLIYDRETKLLYSLMSENNFEILRKRSKIDKVHYIDALSLINNNLKAKNQVTQLTLFDINDENIEMQKEDLLKDILQHINGEVQYYAVITFSTKKYELSSVVTYIPTPQLEVAYLEDWSNHIPVDFDVHLTIDDDVEEDDDEVEVKLRERTVPKNDDIIKLRKHKEEKLT